MDSSYATGFRETTTHRKPRIVDAPVEESWTNPESRASMGDLGRVRRRETAFPAPQSQKLVWKCLFWLTGGVDSLGGFTILLLLPSIDANRRAGAAGRVFGSRNCSLKTRARCRDVH